jgi:hypothetical protein
LFTFKYQPDDKLVIFLYQEEEDVFTLSVDSSVFFPKLGLGRGEALTSICLGVVLQGLMREGVKS